MRIPFALLVALGMAGWPLADLTAQDAHYWTDQYGTEGDLLGGMVIGSSTDLASVFYNPGAMALLENPSVLFNLEAFQFDWLTSTPASGPAPELESFSGGTSPGMVAVALPRSFLSGGRYALSYLSRRGFDTELAGNTIDPRVSSDLSAGEVGQSLSRTLEQNYGEHWIGLTWARAATEGLGLGVTTNAAIRTQDLLASAGNQRFGPEDVAATEAGSLRMSYWHVRLLWKAGAQYNADRWSVGLNVTTPSVGLIGRGGMSRNTSLTGDVESLFPFGAPFSSAGGGAELKPEVHSSWAVGGGGRIPLGEDTDVHLSVEWFDAVDDQVVMGVAPYPSHVPGDLETLEAVHGLNSVVNAGLGFRHRLSPGRALYGAFATDFSGARPMNGEILRTEIALWDLYHFTGGFAARILDSDVTVGVRYSFGSQDVELLAPPLLASGAGAAGTNHVTSHRLKIVLGLSYEFIKGGSDAR